MIVLLNGSFGIGKSTVANLLVQALPGSVVYDPELVGSVLMRLPSWVRLEGSGTDDFQDIRAWRRSVVWGVRLFRAAVAGPVIVPMTFSRLDYLDEVTTGLRQFDTDLRVFCLRASMAIIQTRLEQRGMPPDERDVEWATRRIAECVDAHRDARFGKPVDTEERSALEVAQDIVARLQTHADAA